MEPILAYCVQVSDSEDFPDVTKCLLGCRAIFPGAFFAGVRLMPGTSILIFPMIFLIFSEPFIPFW